MIRQLYSRIPQKSGYVVDIGASSGVRSDPVFPFITDPSFRGLCIEGDSGKTRELRGKCPLSVDIFTGFITPENALSTFARFGVPKDLDILKIDIDGYDLDVLRVLLSEYKPKILIAEINEKIPPPVHFEIPYRPEYRWDSSHCVGFSIAAGHSVLARHGLSIIDIYDVNNILCIDAELGKLLNIPIPEDISKLYVERYVNDPDRLAFHWNESVNYWLTMMDRPKELHGEIVEYFETKNERSTWPVKTKKNFEDFVCKLP
jgi:hypothetical protein